MSTALRSELRGEMALADMWRICAQLLHTPHYRSTHAGILAAAIGERSHSILDTACGSGFPMLDLVDRGFFRIEGADADADLLADCARELAARGKGNRLHHVSWQELAARIPDRFDVVLNADASIGFMDSWSAGAMVSGPDRIFARVRHVLGQFRACVRPGGCLIIGLQKNNNKGNRSSYEMEVGQADIAGMTARSKWIMSYDWRSRVKTWDNLVEIGGVSHRQTRKSYLFDLAELASLLLEAGFARVTQIPTPAELYEDLLRAEL